MLSSAPVPDIPKANLKKPLRVGGFGSWELWVPAALGQCFFQSSWGLADSLAWHIISLMLLGIAPGSLALFILGQAWRWQELTYMSVSEDLSFCHFPPSSNCIYRSFCLWNLHFLCCGWREEQIPVCRSWIFWTVLWPAGSLGLNLMGWIWLRKFLRCFCHSVCCELTLNVLLCLWVLLRQHTLPKVTAFHSLTGFGNCIAQNFNHYTKKGKDRSEKMPFS